MCKLCNHDDCEADSFMYCQEGHLHVPENASELDVEECPKCAICYEPVPR